MRVLGISGSLRRDSHNTALLRAAGELVEERGLEFELFDGLKAIPPYDEDDDVGSGPGPSRAAASDRRCRRGAVLDPRVQLLDPRRAQERGRLGVPAARDERPPQQAGRRDRGEHGMFGAVWAQAELRKVLGATGARVHEVELPVGHAHEAWTRPAPGRPTQEEALRDSVRVLLGERETAEVAA